MIMISVVIMIPVMIIIMQLWRQGQGLVTRQLLRLVATVTVPVTVAVAVGVGSKPHIAGFLLLRVRSTTIFQVLDGICH